MKKALRYVAIGVTALLGLALLAAGIVSLVFDPNNYKADLIRIVHDKTGRILAIDGRIGITVFPHFGVTIDKLALSGPGGEGKFASVGEANVGVALLPLLLERRIVTDHVDLSDVDVDLVKRRDGTTNFDDLADLAAAPDTSLTLVIDGIRVRKANIAWRDEADGRSVRLAGLDAKFGRIAEGASGQFEFVTRVVGSKPDVNAEIRGTGRYKLDFAKGAFAFDDIDMQVAGDVPGAAGLLATFKGDIDLDSARKLVDIAKLTVAATTKDGLDLKARVPKLHLGPSGAAGEAASAEVKVVQKAGTVAAKLQLSGLASAGKQVRFDKVGVDAEVRQGKTRWVARLASPLAIDLDAHTVELPSLEGQLVASGPQVPKQSAMGSVSGGAGLAWGKPSGASADLTARLNDSNLKLKIDVADLDKPAIQFKVTADRLDLSQYYPPTPAKRGGAPPADGKAVMERGGGVGAPEQVIDLSGLGKLNANGSVRIGAFTGRHIRAQDLHVGVRVAGGLIELSPINANLYRGALAGSASVDTHTNQFSIREQFKDVELGALLRDAAGFNTIEGRGSIALDITTTGTTVSAMKRALNGSVRIDVRDGYVKGVNLVEIANETGTQLGSKTAVEGKAKATDQTSFSRLSGSFAIQSGVARTGDLAGLSPQLKVTGAGIFDIGTERIDYLVKVTPLLAIPIGSRTETVLKGVAIPVRIAGPLAAPAYSVDLAQLVVESAKAGVTLPISAVVGVPKAAVSPVKDLLHGLRGKE
jgi:AsmA protein